MALPASFAEFNIKIINTDTLYLIIFVDIRTYNIDNFGSCAIPDRTTVDNQYIHIYLLKNC